MVSELIFLVIAVGPWVAGVVFARAVLASVRKNWRAAATSARTATLLQIPVFVGIVLSSSVHEQPLVSPRDYLMLINASLALVLSAVSSILWFVMVALTLVARPSSVDDSQQIQKSAGP